MKKHRKSAISLVMLALAVLLLSACGAGNTAHKSGSSATEQQPAASQSATKEASVELENMGVKMVFPEAPKRAITLNQHATEVMLALGLESSMVGTAYLDDSILPEYKAQYDKIPVLVPSSTRPKRYLWLLRRILPMRAGRVPLTTKISALVRSLPNRT